MTKSLGLYIHFPFCKRKCAYCDFYSGVPNGSGIDGYKDALIKELEKWGGEVKNRPIDTIYLGGGTPSLLGYRVGAVLSAVYKNFNVTDNAEITAEVNPESAAEFLPYAKKAGVNRISIGVQSGNDAMLKRLGRLHTKKESDDTVSLARKIGFNNVSVDLMIGLPDSDRNTLALDLDFILSLDTEHISAYILKCEENTPLYKQKVTLPDEDNVAEQYLFMCERLENAGYRHYEISNFSKKDKESKHNLKYWRDEEYIGIGPAAHSFFEGKRFYYPRNSVGFMTSPKTVFDGEGGDSEEKLMLGLRLSEGIDLSEIYGEIPDRIIAKITMLQKAGYIIKKGSRVSLTDSGMLVSNSIITELTE